jgi:hypothetical protein
LFYLSLHHEPCNWISSKTHFSSWVIYNTSYSIVFSTFSFMGFEKNHNLCSAPSSVLVISQDGHHLHSLAKRCVYAMRARDEPGSSMTIWRSDLNMKSWPK